MAIAWHREVERKYDVQESDLLPTLDDLPGVAAVDAPVTLDLTATYFDDPGLTLLRAGITLRRRTGGEDDGWHLKLPGGTDERHELQLPISAEAAAGSVPDQLAVLVQAHLRGRGCAPVATLRTHRVVHRIRDDRDNLLAELSDDTVTAQLHERDGSVTTSRWREWEVEGGDIPERLWAALDQAIRDAGGRSAAASSKLARALGGRLPHDRGLVEREPTKDGPAAVVVLAHLRSQVAELRRRDPQVRRDLPDSVHKMRVATRRLRSALATFRPLLDKELANGLRDELKWLAGILGSARDAEVMRDRLAGLASAEPAELGTERVAGEFQSLMQKRYDEALTQVHAVLSSARYFRLLDSLDLLAESPPWTDRAADPARQALPKQARSEWKRLAKRAKKASRADTPAERDHHLHEVRKAAKRLRYACEALAPVFGSPAAELARAAEDVQEILGDHQDSVVSQQLLRDLAARTTLTGDEALIYGRLHLLEQTHAEHARSQYKTALQQVRDRRPKGWD